MIRRALRYGIRLGLLGGIAFALFRILESRRTQQSGGSAGWPPGGATPAPAPATMASAGPGPGPVPATPSAIPPEPPDPDLVDPVMLTSIGGFPQDESGGSPDNGVGTLGSAPPAPAPEAKEKPAAKKAAPAKKAAAKKAAPRKPAEPAEPAETDKPDG